MQPDSTEQFAALPDSVATDSLHFDFPEGMTAEIDSLLNGWQARNLSNRSTATPRDGNR